MLSRGDAGRTSAGTAQHRGIQRRDRGGGSVDGTSGMVVAATQNGIVVPDERTAAPVVRALRALHQDSTALSVPLSELLETIASFGAKEFWLICVSGKPCASRAAVSASSARRTGSGGRQHYSTQSESFPVRAGQVALAIRVERGNPLGARNKMAISLSCRVFPS